MADGPSAAFVGPDGALYCSDDGGRAWQSTITGLPAVYALLIERGSGYPRKRVMTVAAAGRA